MHYRPPMFPPPNLPLAPKQTINYILNQKRPNSSEYRTHFTLMNVYRPPSASDYQFVNRIAYKLKRYFNCDIVQISYIVDDDRVDLAIGLQSDRDAMIFLMRNEDIKLDTEKYGEYIYQPIVSNVFKTYLFFSKRYMSAKRHLYPQIVAEMSRIYPQGPIFEPPKSIQQPKKKQSPPLDPSRRSKSQSSSSSGSSFSRSSNGENSQRKGNMKRYRSRNNQYSSRYSSRYSRSPSKSHQKQRKNEDKTLSFSESIKQSFMVQEIWIFCVPLEYDERDVYTRLKERKIYPVSSSWRMIEDMEFLYLRLYRSISSEVILNIDFKIGIYPCIVLPKIRNYSELRQEIKKYQSQLISYIPLREETLVKCLIYIGGVLSIVKDDYDDVERYIITFCSIQRVRKFEQKIKEIFGTKITISPVDEPVRFCRVEKMFAIYNMINDFAEKLKRSDFL